MEKKILTEEISYLTEEKKIAPKQPTEQNFLSESARTAEKYPAKSEKSLLVLITGGAAAGKTTFAEKVKEHLEQVQKRALILSLDFYKNQKSAQSPTASASRIRALAICSFFG